MRTKFLEKGLETGGFVPGDCFIGGGKALLEKDSPRRRKEASVGG